MAPKMATILLPFGSLTLDEPTHAKSTFVAISENYFVLAALYYQCPFLNVTGIQYEPTVGKYVPELR